MNQECLKKHENAPSEIFTEAQEARLKLSQSIQDDLPEKKLFPNQSETYWDTWNRTDTFYPEGKIPKTAIREISGRKYMLDIGLTFALTKPGDTRDGVSAEVGQTNPAGRDFSHLKPGKSKYQSINIPAKYFPANRWIPMPLKAEQRILTPEQFLNYASKAVDEMLQGETLRDVAYAEQVKEIVKKFGKDEIICLMMAAAKQESGGAPLGQFVFHRWEQGRNDFSHSIFHIMLEGAGARARQKLGMTPGQMNHPKNSCKMFLAFVIEKHLGKFIGATRQPSATETANFIYKKYGDEETWAEFYNGGGWKSFNPDYATNIEKYKKEAYYVLKHPTSAEKYAELEEKREAQKERKNQTKTKRENVLIRELDNALKNNQKKSDEKYICSLSETEKEQLVVAAENLLKDFSPNDRSFIAGDSLLITANESRIYVRIRREADEDWWGPRTIPRTTPVKTTEPEATNSLKEKVPKTTPEKTESLSEEEYRDLVEEEVRARLRGNFWRKGEKYITLSSISSEELRHTIDGIIKYLKRVAPNEPFDPEKHDILITSDETHIWIRIQRESDESLIGGGATKVSRDTE